MRYNKVPFDLKLTTNNADTCNLVSPLGSRPLIAKLAENLGSILAAFNSPVQFDQDHFPTSQFSLSHV